MSETKRKVVDITQDGTLIVNTRHYDDVKRIVIRYGDKPPRGFVPAKKEPDNPIYDTFVKDSYN